VHDQGGDPANTKGTGHHAGADLKVDDEAVLRRRQRGVVEVVARLAQLRLQVGDRGVDAVDLGFVLETSALELAQRFGSARLRGVRPSRASG
jgi:hypothetical protein